MPLIAFCYKQLCLYKYSPHISFHPSLLLSGSQIGSCIDYTPDPLGKTQQKLLLTVGVFV